MPCMGHVGDSLTIVTGVTAVNLGRPTSGAAYRCSGCRIGQMLPISPSRTWLAGALTTVLAAAAMMLAPQAQANGCIATAAGTAQDPYLIATEANLDCLMSNANDYWAGGFHFRQTADLDMSNYAAWTRGIGSVAMPFNGNYDGDGFSIDNLTITSSGSGVGLFGVTAGATLTNISLTNLQVTGDRQVGGLVGLLDGGTVDNAQIHATVTGLCTSNASNCSVGGLAGQIDDSVPTAISSTWSSGSVTATVNVGTSTYGRGAGGLIGSTTTSQLTVSDSASTAAVSGHFYVGGLIGIYVESSGSETFALTDSYATGPVTASQDSGGLVGCFYDNFISNQCDSPYGSVTVTDTYWDTQTTGRNTTAANRGTPKTTAQMTSLDTFGSWSIADTTPANATWGICTALNSGYPFLQWVAEQRGWTCTAPTPPPTPAPIPATPPTGVEALPGDASATVMWSAPASSGSYAVSTYLVRSSPEGRICMTTALSCTVTGLRNGTPYTFAVEALTGAGWSAPSAPSAAVTPVKPRSIVITGIRKGPAIVISGTSAGMAGQSLVVMVRLRGEKAFAERGEVTPEERGNFTWRTRAGKTVHVYVTGDGITSNRVKIVR